ncbi:FadR/GntR family transcriptional regulator [Priestia endophytica]|uniref:FadR/GntR family transcriptional regulator n=1 Tax=Priestia endophytica TaxID=135735 RepID=UPI00227E48F2|nr:FadR/GntR family transcriptional regulator [Priestia endophytica]
MSDFILSMIREGTLKPGDKLLSVHQLAEQFGVGRSAVREALSAVRAMGLIEMRQGEGTYVKKFDHSHLLIPLHSHLLLQKEDLVHLFEVRKIVEVGAVRAAAIKRTKENLKEMERWIDKGKTVAGDKEGERVIDFHFHLTIVKASHNLILLKLMSHISKMIEKTIHETYHSILYEEQITKNLFCGHLAIYEAIKKQDVESASKAMMNHLIESEKLQSVLRHHKDEYSAI